MDFKDIIKRIKSFEERRKSPRVLLDLPLEYRTQYSPRTRGGIVIDASEVGFLIHSIENMLVGTQLKIVVLYPLGYGLGNLEVSGEVVWKKVDKKERRYLYGFKFNGILKEDRYKLKGLLKHELVSPLSISIRSNVEKEKFKGS